jgi:hypothetical protein
MTNGPRLKAKWAKLPKAERARRQQQSIRDKKAVSGGRRRGNGGVIEGSMSRNAPVLRSAKLPEAALRTVRTGKTVGGSRTEIIEFKQYLTSLVQSDGVGAVGYSLTVYPDLFTRNTQFKSVYDKCRLKSFLVEFKPQVAISEPGIILGYFDYRNDGIVSTVSAASLVQDYGETRPFQRQVFHWRKQDNSDNEFVSTSAAAFNSVSAHKFFLVGEGCNSSINLGRLCIKAVIEYTGRV